MVFTPCQGKTVCREDGKRCQTCGRSPEEITWLRDLMDQLTNMAIAYEYYNVDQFAAYIAHKLPKMVAHRLAVAQEAAVPAKQETAYVD